MKMKKMKVFTSMMTMSVLSAELSMAFAGAATFPAKVITAVNNVLDALTVVGVIVCAGMIAFAGFKFLTAGAGEKAKAKDMLVPMAVGGILVAFAGPIAKWAWSLVTNETVTVGITD